MKRITKFLPVAMLLAAIPLTGFAQPGPEGSQGEMRGQLKGIYESLTAEQKEQIKDLRTAHQKETVDLRADLEKQMIELRELISDDASESKIMAKIEEIGRKRTEMQKKKVKLMLEIKNLLTDEQKEMFDGLGLHGLIGGPGGHSGSRGNRGPSHMRGGSGEPGGEGPFEE
ncbi:Spy/CpxP family protein refolding chaperone [candidate division WOR-3 bacterium]|nr:Spy/CpxP family protein refolding chaperone [candidate division WOR-3 bacterium]